ncbi:MAG: tRNA (guanosine(46)-N7)-methyltransferase TrmB [Defluviitaleaceae bacterium]|nr:tRNA (guanosine(46)-N7)-methyltransferase TrmB [Defluviitaleaceae bacterium]
MRIRKHKWTQKELQINKAIVQDGTVHKGKWNEFFGNDNPIHIELGSGKGGFFAEMSLQHQDINYIAIERQTEIIVSGARKIRELKERGSEVDNLAFLRGDARDLLDYFEEGEICQVFINFCDPWPNRKKWHKRRLTHHSFLEIYRKLLSANGEIHFKTDHTELFEFSLNEFSDNNWKLKNISLDLHNSNFEDNIMTEYEQKFFEKGMVIYRLEAICLKDKLK